MISARRRTLIALALQAAALAVLAAALLGQAWLDARSRPRALVLLDRSNSMPAADADRALAEVRRAAGQAGIGELRVIGFAGRAGEASAPAGTAPTATATPDAAALDPTATNLQVALDAALSAHAVAGIDHLVVVSDGHANAGDTARALQSAHDAGLVPHWWALGRPAPETRVSEVLAPDRAQLGQRIRIAVQLAGRLDRPLRLKGRARSSDGETQSASVAPALDGRAALDFDARRSGPLRLDLVLEDTTTGQPLATLDDAALVDVAPRAAVLYVQGSPSPLADSLRRGGWSLDLVPAAQLDTRADALEGVQAVVLDDVAIGDAGPRFWNALVAAVRQRGLGLLVLGGERSFARGGYRGSVLESVLPLLSEPAALDQPASVLFAVDKSGSMGQGSGGVDRFQLAQRAVLDTARGLSERDALGLLVFDAAPRLLLPLGPAPAGVAVLARDWPVTPNGGTQLAPALDAAIAELERAGSGRRLLVLVTDGFVDDAPREALRARLSRAHIDTLALAVGPDADVAALQRLFAAPGDRVLHAEQAADLPRLMPAELERRRARVERGSIVVQQRQPLPFPPGLLDDWPMVAAHHVTRPAPAAQVVLQSPRGDPLLAWQRVGAGRVLALSAGLGPWAPQWPRWREWSRLAGGLTGWVAGAAPGGSVALSVSDRADDIRIDADLRDGAHSQADAPPTIRVDTPTASGRVLTFEAVAPGRLRATLPAAGTGLYTVTLSGTQGTARRLHLRRADAEDAAWGTNPALQRWAAEGLLRPWTPGALAPTGATAATRRPVDRSLILLALLLCAAGVAVDRAVWVALGALFDRLRRARGRA